VVAGAGEEVEVGAALVAGPVLVAVVGQRGQQAAVAVLLPLLLLGARRRPSPRLSRQRKWR
jgi:hypothetical protein